MGLTDGTGDGAPIATPVGEQEDEFVLQIRALEGDRLDGYVLHRGSGRRQAVTGWDQVTLIITQMLAAADGFADSDEEEDP